MSVRGTALAVGFLLVATLPAHAADDATVQKEIEARLAKAGLDKTGNVQVDVHGGVASLTGITLSLRDRIRAEEAAAKEAESVDSRLQVFPEKRADHEIEKGVADAILGYVYYGVFDSISAGVTDGVATLRGSVRDEYRRDQIFDRVVRVPGLRDVKNEIRVQPVSFLDDRLRRELVNKIYYDPNGLFVRFASAPNPPVRIIVENGRVTLTGYVGTVLEQRVLTNIARGTLAFQIDNQVQLESDRAREEARATQHEG
jgi:hyperosmotically inducible periplasmic protein